MSTTGDGPGHTMAAMQFMVVETYRHGARPVYERFERDGRMMPGEEGIEFVASWVSADLRRCLGPQQKQITAEVARLS